MFGFSLPKLLFTILVIAAVWYGFKMLARWQERRGDDDGESAERAPARRRRRRSAREDDAPGDAEDMVPCALCGTYVAAAGARSCGRADCPYPG